MNKIHLIQSLKDSNHLSKSEAEAVVNLVFNEISDALAQGDRVEIRGLCSSFIKNYRPYRMNSSCIVASVRSGIAQQKKDSPGVINAMNFLVIILKIFPWQ